MEFSQGLDLDLSLLEGAFGGIGDGPGEGVSAEGLGFDEDASQLSFLEVALGLYGVEELLVVQVSFAEIPSEGDAGDEFAVDVFVFIDVFDGFGEEELDGAALEVHGAKGHDFGEERGDGVLVVE